MIRDFTKGKKEEIYRALDRIDDKDWKPFMAWCGGRAGEFGVWADRLEISSYTRQIDSYHNRVLQINKNTRDQVNATFESVTETDRRYAEIFQEYAETVRKQIRRIQIMIQAMQSSDRTHTDIRAFLQRMDSQSGVPYEEQLTNGRKVLESYLKVRGITDPAEQQAICDLIMEKQPDMLISLYIRDCYSDKSAGAIYSSMLEYYNRHKMDIAMEDVEDLDLGDGLDQLQRETFVACWNRLGQMGLSKEQMIAVMANIYDESRYSATNAQESFGYKGLYDDYTYKTDDSVGYGICQWTVESRKVALLNYAAQIGGSVHD